MAVAPASSPNPTQGLQQALGKNALGKDAFLKLFVHQLKNQDPFNPMDAKESSAQLAQFSQLEQTTQMNATLQKMLKQTMINGVNNAVSFIGKQVVAGGFGLTKNGNSVSSVTYNVTKPAASVKVHIYDDKKRLIQTVNLGAKSAGDFDFQWNGVDSKGKKVADGKFTVAFEARDANDKLVRVNTKVAGTVSSVTIKSGQIVLKLSDGREVLMNNVMEVKDKPQAQA